MEDQKDLDQKGSAIDNYLKTASKDTLNRALIFVQKLKEITLDKTKHHIIESKLEINASEWVYLNYENIEVFEIVFGKLDITQLWEFENALISAIKQQELEEVKINTQWQSIDTLKV